MLEVTTGMNTSSFFLRRDDGAVRPLVKVAGRVKVAAWGPEGFAAIVDDRLLLWETRTGSLTQLLQAPFVRDVVNLTMAGRGQVVLATDRTVLLLADDSVSILVVARAYPRFANGVLYLFEEATGIVWSIAGLDRIGTREADRDYAHSLLSSPSNADGENVREAIRLVGCSQVLEWMKN